MKIQFEITEKDTIQKIFDRVSKDFVNMIGAASIGKWELKLQKPVRTTAQNRALWLFLGWLAEALNESHNLLTMSYFGKTFEVRWNKDMVKERIWDPIQKAMTQKKSSTKLTTTELTKVAEAIRDNLSSSLNIVLNFPNELDRQLGIKPFEL